VVFRNTVTGAGLVRNSSGRCGGLEVCVCKISQISAGAGREREKKATLARF